MKKNATLIKWIAGALVSILCVVLATLFCTWQGSATECSEQIEVVEGEHHKLDKRVTRVETNMENIDKSLERIDDRLGRIERAVR